MSEDEAEHPQRYCTNCGAPVRPGNAFCVSCGVQLSTGKVEETGPGYERSISPEQPHLSFGASDVGAQRAPGQLGDALSGMRTDSLGTLFGRAVRWFRGLPIIAKVALVALVVLVLLVFFSPLGLFASVLAFGASLIVLIVRQSKEQPVKGWAVAAVGSLVLAFAFSGAALVFYGGGPTADSRFVVSEGSQSQEDEVAPGLEETARRWSSSSIDSPLFVPSYLPYPVLDVEINFTASSFAPLVYQIVTQGGRVALVTSGRAGSESYNANTPGVRTIMLEDGRTYYYVIENSGGTGASLYGYSGTTVRFWGEDTFFFMLEVDPSMTYDEQMSILESMVRVDSRATRGQ